MGENELYQSEHIIVFVEKKWHKHVCCFLNYFYKETVAFFVLVVTFGGSSGMLAAALGNRILIGRLVLPVIVVALASNYATTIA